MAIQPEQLNDLYKTSIGRNATPYEYSQYSNMAIPKIQQNLNSYSALNKDNSVVDYLKYTGQDSSPESRAALATQYGLQGYNPADGNKNLELLKALKAGKPQQAITAPAGGSISAATSNPNVLTLDDHARNILKYGDMGGSLVRNPANTLNASALNGQGVSQVSPATPAAAQPAQPTQLTQPTQPTQPAATQAYTQTSNYAPRQNETAREITTDTQYATGQPPTPAASTTKEAEKVVRESDNAYQEYVDAQAEVRKIDRLLKQSYQEKKDQIERSGGIVNQAQLEGLVQNQNAPLVTRRAELAAIQAQKGEIYQKVLEQERYDESNRLARAKAEQDKLEADRTFRQRVMEFAATRGDKDLENAIKAFESGYDTSGATQAFGEGVVAGYDISRYATDPNHESAVARIYSSLPELTTVQAIDSAIKNASSTSPITGEMVAVASNKYGVDPKMVVAMMMQDSSLGTRGLGARTNNPGNVGNDDEGNVRTYNTLQDGVNAVAEWLSKNKSTGQPAQVDPRTLAYAKEYATTGKMPSNMPKGLFEKVQSAAMTLPKQKGLVVSTLTGVKNDSVPAAAQDDFARLYNIVESTKRLKELDDKRWGGIVAGTLGKVFGSQDQEAYLALRKSIVDDLSRMQSGAALTEDEVDFYEGYLPGRFSEPTQFNLGPDSAFKIKQFEEIMNNRLKERLATNGLSIYGFSEVDVDGQKYVVGSTVTGPGGTKGRVNPDGTITNIN